jgi:hypothetical protein
MPSTGIQTLYKGTRYRSRLEARWAAFFDSLGWEAHYEPFDLDGWIPDFIVRGRSFWRDEVGFLTSKVEPVVVEVKPVEEPNDPVFKQTVEKIERSRWRGEALIVSYFLPLPNIGWMREECACFNITDPCIPRCWNWGDASFQTTERHQAIAGFCSAIGSYHDRISGYYPGGQLGADDAEEIEKLWRLAGNTVQWRA